MQQVTITDVARQAGVSKGLVSLVLNNRPGVAQSTRERVLSVASDLGWAPNQYARGLSLRTTYTLGLVLRRDAQVLASDPFFPSFIAGVESVLSVAGWSLMLSVATDEATELQTYRSLAPSRVDGFFLTDLRLEDPRPALLEDLGSRGVLVGPSLPPSSLPSVNLDDTVGVTSTVEHLLGLGHRRIGYVTGDTRMVHGHSRLECVRRALLDAGCTTDLIRPGDFSASSGAAATEELLGLTEPPTAIVYASDPMAIAGLGVLQAHGISVPEQMSVVGFDGVELGGHLHPPLTTVRTDPYRWGVEAARLLHSLSTSDRETQELVGHDLPPAELLVRGSTAAPHTR